MWFWLRKGSTQGFDFETSKQSLEFALIQTGLARKTDFILSSKYTLLGWNGSTDVLPPP